MQLPPLAASVFASGAFWTITVGALATLVGAAVGAWITNRLNNPKRRMHYSWIKNVSLLHDSGGGATSMSMHYGASALTKPRIIDLSLFNAGRQPITAQAFHAGSPMEIDLDAQIVDVLSVTSEPPTSIAPSWTTTGSRLTLPPFLLVAEQKVTFSVVVDGDADSLRLQSPLTDVEPVNVTPGGESEKQWERRVRRIERLNMQMQTVILYVLVLASLAGVFFMGKYALPELGPMKKVQDVCRDSPPEAVAKKLGCPD